MDRDSQSIFFTLSDLFSEETFHNPLIVYGLTKTPDFGYFELGKRYWASGVCIYLVGAAEGFSGNGIGYTEPWLYLVRHSTELCLKSMNLYLLWLEALQLNRYQEVAIDINEILTTFKKDGLHDLQGLYDKYKKKNQDLSQLQPVPDFIEPGLQDMMLNKENEKILNGFHEIDPNSFKFRYPTEHTSTAAEKFQEVDWRHNPQEVEVSTKIAKISGTFFNHLDAFEQITSLYQGLSEICNAFENSGILVRMEQQQELYQLYIKQLSGI